MVILRGGSLCCVIIIILGEMVISVVSEHGDGINSAIKAAVPGTGHEVRGGKIP